VIIGRVIGAVVATRKHATLTGQKLLLVTPERPDGARDGDDIVVVDGVGAGVGERVMVVLEGRSAGDIVGAARAPVDAAIVGIVDQLTVTEPTRRSR